MGGGEKLLGGVPGVRPADVVVLGGGIVGSNAAKIALGMGAHVTIIDSNADRLRYLDEVLHGNLTTLGSNLQNIADSVKHADGVIGSVLIPGAKAPKLVSREIVAAMKPGSVIVDVAIDQGGCVETSRPTKHSNPVYCVDEVIHYCVTNMPGAVPRTSTYALNNVTLPYVLKIAKSGLMEALRNGRISCPGRQYAARSSDQPPCRRGSLLGICAPYRTNILMIRQPFKTR